MTGICYDLNDTEGELRVDELMIFHTLYTTLHHNLIKDKLIDLIERTFQREGSPYLACNDRNAFFTSEKPKNIMHGRVKMYVMR